jgi:acetylornithine deacetylase
MSEVIDVLRELVSISSVSRESNRGVISYAERVLAGAGCSFAEHIYDDPAGVEKVNLIAWPGNAPPDSGAFHLVLVCHTDTVPYADDWRDATTLIEAGGDLKGCGACDVKGYLACILAAASRLDGTRLKRPLGIVLTADEEIGCVGARYLVEQKLLSARYAIVGEPTSLQPVRAGKGYCLAEVTVTGRAAHSAYPERGKSAIHAAARLIVEIEAIAERLKELRVAGFDPPWTTINVGEIHGGVAKNIVAPSCRFLLEWRPVAGQDPGLVAELVREACGKLGEGEPEIQFDLKVLRMQEGFALDSESDLLRAIVRASGCEAGSVAFGTEAPWMNRLGAAAVVFGPGSMYFAHSSREFVPSDELHRCVEILEGVIYELCEGPNS